MLMEIKERKTLKISMKHGHGKQLKNKHNLSGTKTRKTLSMMKKQKEKNFIKHKKLKT